MIPLVDLQSQYRAIKPEIDAAVLDIFDSAQFVLGPAVSSFEKRFAAFCQTSEAIGTSSGTSALHLTLLVRVPHRDAVRASLTAAGVQTGVHYPIPIHLQPAYRDLGHQAGDFPVCESAAADVLSLPIYPELTEAQLALVASSLRVAVSAHAAH